MLAESEVFARTDDFIAQQFPGISLRNVLPHPLKIPGGWRVVYEAYPQFELRQSGTMVIVFMTDNGIVATPEVEYSEFDPETAPGGPPILQESEIEQLIQKAKLPSLNAAINLIKQRLSPEAVVIAYEPVINTLMQQMKLQILCWKFDIFVGNSHHKVLVSCHDDDPQTLDLYSLDISDQTRHSSPPSELEEYRHLKEYGRLDLDYQAKQLRIRVNLSWLDPQDTFSPTGLMTMRDELLLWFCKKQAANYLERIGYSGLDYSLITLERKEVTLAEIDQAQVPELDPAGIVFIGRNATIISPIVFRNAQKAEPLMVSWLQDPSIVFHELGHALRYLLYTQEHDHGIEEGFCDYFSAVLMDDLLKSQGFAYREEDGIGSLLPHGLARGRFLPRRFGGEVNPPDYPDLSETERPYALGWKWAHFLWQLRHLLYQITNDWLKADEIITVAHLKPRLPKVKDGLSTPTLYQQSLLTTMRVNNIILPEEAWNELLAANPLVL